MTAVALILLPGQTGYTLTIPAVFGIDRLGDQHDIATSWAGPLALAHVGAVVHKSRRRWTKLPKSVLTRYKSMPTTGDGT